MGFENTHCRDCKIRHTGRFKDINPDCLDTLSNNKTCNIYKKGQLLLHEGSRPMGVYCIKEGKVKVVLLLLVIPGEFSPVILKDIRDFFP